MSKDPSEIRHDIEQTRERMEDTVEALAYKTDVSARAKDAVNDRVETVKGAVTGAFGAARENISGAANTAQNKIGHGADNAEPVMAGVRQAASGAAAGAGAAVASAKSALTGAGNAVRDAASNARRGIPTSGDARASLGNTKGTVSDNPLGLALASIAIGFLIGSLVPVSDIERDQIGPLGEQLTENAKTAASDLVEQGKAAVSQAVTDTLTGKSHK